MDQALLSVLTTKFSTLRHCGLLSEILIVDEVHELGQPNMDSSLQTQLKVYRMVSASGQGAGGRGPRLPGSVDRRGGAARRAPP